MHITNVIKSSVVSGNVILKWIVRRPHATKKKLHALRKRWRHRHLPKTGAVMICSEHPPWFKIGQGFHCASNENARCIIVGMTKDRSGAQLMCSGLGENNAHFTATAEILERFWIPDITTALH